MKDPTQLLTTIAVKILEYKRSREREKDSWKWGEGVQLYYNPEARCPHCREWASTNRVWLVDDSNKKLVRCWDLKGKPLVQNLYSERLIVHPHVTMAGTICTGNIDDASNALFLSIDKGNHYYNSELWFWQLGHDCPELEKGRCNLCRETYPLCSSEHYEAYDRDYLLCTVDCLRVAELFRCSKCFSERPFYEPNNRRKLCESCYIGETLQCGFCEERVFPEEVDGISRYCTSHLYICECENCGCEARLSEPIICNWCLNNCSEEEKIEPL